MLNLVKGIFALFVASMVVFSACSSDSEDEVEPDCDLDNVTYSETIAPIMETHCNSCHSGASPSAGIVTADYEGLRELAVTSSLVGVVNHDPDYSAMPQGQPQLDECLREQIAVWVNDGAQDN